LLLGQHLFYLAACAAVVVAARPLVPGRGLRLALFALLAFNPMSFSAPTLRVQREGIYQSLTLLVVATVVGVVTRSGRGRRALAAWAVAAGAVFAAFWLTREE